MALMARMDGDRAALADEMNQKLGDVDHAGFIGEAMAVLDGLGDEDDGMTKTPFAMDIEPGSLDVQGDRATFKVDGKDAVLRKIDGRWFLSFRESEF